MRPSLFSSVSFVFWATVFALIYCQAPLYYSNQNQYFLHGLASAGRGFLNEDWLVNTLDPTPLFSTLVAFTSCYLHEDLFYGAYALLMGVYFVSMAGLFGFLAGERNRPRLRWVFLALFLLVYSALARWCSYRWLGLDYPWYFQAGVAGQYVLGAMFQPSTFGVLLVLSLTLFIKNRPLAAVACACLAAVAHSTYLLGAGLLTFAYLCVLVREGQVRKAVLLGALALALVLPSAVYVITTFGPSSPGAFAEAQHILVQDRIPHHTLVGCWLDPIALAQVGWIALALGLVRGTRLFPVLGLVFLLSCTLTLVQIVTGSETLALMFPWRTSVVLVPVATTILLSRLVVAGASWLDRSLAGAASVILVAGLVGAGVAILYGRLGFQSSEEELPLLEYVRDHKTRGDVYLLPVRVPKLAATTKGSLSSDFKPVADKQRDARLIPVDLQRFRLYTGAAIYVDFKSLPYKDVEVLEWHARLQRNQEICAHLQAGRWDEAVAAMGRLQITHAVLTQDCKVNDPRLQLVHEDAVYRVYRLVVSPPDTEHAQE